MRRGLPSPSFPAVTLTAGRTWHQVARLAVHDRAACALGCRGFAGPIPPPLWMSVIQLCPIAISVPHGIASGDAPPDPPRLGGTHPSRPPLPPTPLPPPPPPPGSPPPPP